MSDSPRTLDENPPAPLALFIEICAAIGMGLLIVNVSVWLQVLA